MLFSLFAFALVFLEGGGLRCSPVENLDSGELMGVNAIEHISKCGTEDSIITPEKCRGSLNHTVLIA